MHRSHLIYKKPLFNIHYNHLVLYLGQTYIKYHGEHVEKAILMGVEGLNHTFKLPSDLDRHFEKIRQLVAQDASLSEDIPNLVDLYQKVAKKYGIEMIIPNEENIIFRIKRY